MQMLLIGYIMTWSQYVRQYFMSWGQYVLQ